MRELRQKYEAARGTHLIHILAEIDRIACMSTRPSPSIRSRLQASRSILLTFKQRLCGRRWTLRQLFECTQCIGRHVAHPSSLVNRISQLGLSDESDDGVIGLASDDGEALVGGALQDFVCLASYESELSAAVKLKRHGSPISCMGMPLACITMISAFITLTTEQMGQRRHFDHLTELSRLTRLNVCIIVILLVFFLQEWIAVEPDHLIGDTSSTEKVADGFCYQEDDLNAKDQRSSPDRWVSDSPWSAGYRSKHR